MKKTHLLVVSLWLAGCATLWSQGGSKVKTLDYKDFALDESSDEGKLKLLKREYKEFDANGRQTKFVQYQVGTNGQIIKLLENNKTYAPERTDEIVKYSDKGEELSYEKNYYNAQDKKSKMEYSDKTKANGERFRKEYTYTAFNKPQTVTLFNSQNKKIGEETWKYNKEDEEIEYEKWETLADGSKYEEQKKTAYNKDGSLAKSEKTIKDKGDVFKEEVTFERNRVKEQVKYKNGEIVSQFGGTAKASYDPSKAKVLMEFNNGGGDGILASEDEFDDKGNKIKTTQTVDGVVTQVIHYTYDSRNNPIKIKKVSYQEEIETGSEEEVTEYDNNNNIKRKATYSNGFLIAEKTYDYQYHP